MELVKGINSYITVDEANSIVNDIFYTDEVEALTWDSLSDKDKSKLIYRATKLIDSLVFIGIQYIPGSELSWPRVISGRCVDCPFDIKAAILMQGIKDKQNIKNEEIKLKELGVKTYTIKGASISFSDVDKYKLNNGIYNSVYELYLNRWVR